MINKLKYFLTTLIYSILLLILIYNVYSRITSYKDSLERNSKNVYLTKPSVLYFNPKFKTLDLDLTNFNSSNTYIIVSVDGLLSRIRVDKGETLGSLRLENEPPTLPFQTYMRIELNGKEEVVNVMVKER